MKRPSRVLIVGGVACGPKAASRLKCLFSDKTATGDCPKDYLPYLIENEVQIEVCAPCARNRKIDETKFPHNMALDGSPHLIEKVAEAKVFNF
jgi:sulfur relay (sulfurtransferase) complex TusBCD TusD component (DsrE family)